MKSPYQWGFFIFCDRLSKIFNTRKVIMLTELITQTFGTTSYLDIVLLFGIALVISSIGFYRLLYFINIGYAFAIVGMILLMLFRHIENFSPVSLLENLFLAIWGLRLGLYLVQREFQAGAYDKYKNETHASLAKISVGVKIIIWISVSILYVLMFSPNLFLLTERPTFAAWPFYLVQGIGLLLMGGGLILEWLADKQKSDFKAERPRDYCDTGLYRLVRCPNYLGEVTIWVGNWVVGIPFYTTPAHWIISIIGMSCIILIMMISTQRLENAQDERYGDRAEYQIYIKSVPVLFPFVPVYSLKKVRIIPE